MTILGPEFLHTISKVGLVILTGAMALAVYRIIRGPENADRIIALDLLSVLLVSVVALYAVFAGEKMFLDVAIAFALVAFLGTVAFARYLERSGRPSRKSHVPDDKGGLNE